MLFQQALIKPSEWIGGPSALSLQAAACIGHVPSYAHSSANANGKPTATIDIEAMQKQIAELTSLVALHNGSKNKPGPSSPTNAEVENADSIHAATASPLYISPDSLDRVSQPSLVSTETEAEVNNGFNTATSPIEEIAGQGCFFMSHLRSFYSVCIPCSNRSLTDVFLDFRFRISDNPWHGQPNWCLSSSPPLLPPPPSRLPQILLDCNTATRVQHVLQHATYNVH
jgi:hypothetical protein